MCSSRPLLPRNFYYFFHLLMSRLTLISYIIIINPLIYCPFITYERRFDMNKEIFKCILSIICILCGAILSILSLISFDTSSPAFIACILLGMCLVIIGVVSFFLHLRGHKIIRKLQNKELTILAHWQYSPIQFSGVSEIITQDRSSNISIVILLGVLSLLIALGILLSDSPFALILCITIGLISLLTCMLSCMLIHIHYHNKLLRPAEAIIGESYIFFNEELYSLQRSFYLLTDVKLVEDRDVYLQFLYGSPCTDCGPIYVLSIPVPSDQVEVAQCIKQHYMTLIH